jgi:hypothetical protein
MSVAIAAVAERAEAYSGRGNVLSPHFHASTRGVRPSLLKHVGIDRIDNLADGLVGQNSS